MSLLPSLQNKSGPRALLDFAKSFSRLPYFIAGHFFAASVLFMISGIIIAGLIYWQIRLKTPESLKTAQVNLAVDEKKYRQVIDILNLAELLRQKVDPGAYNDIF